MDRPNKHTVDSGCAAGPTSAATAAASTRAVRRQAWNASTRLRVKARATSSNSSGCGQAAKPRRKGKAEDVDAEQDVAVRQTLSHSRCSSPTCRDRKSKRQVEFAESREEQLPEPSLAVDPTHAMIERAVDSALSSAMQDADSTLDKSIELLHDQPREQPRLLDLLTTADSDTSEWRRQYVNRRERNDRAAMQQHNLTQKAAQVQRVIRSARFEYEQRKLEIQALQKRVQREIHFLQATAAELSEREALMDEAFAGYAQWVQGEGDEDNACAG